ncbi:MAG: hypothetical protein H7Y13_17450 [Sphingobacteriaceae bacterium]|nr:hypothetical protein [Sphingobacteriaceae bacterium]
MSDKQKNSVVILTIITVILLILFIHPDNEQNLFKSSAPVSEPYFPTVKDPQTETMEALLSGELKLAGKCLKIEGNLIVWPYGFSVVKGDTLAVINEKGKVVAKVGDTVKLSGGQVGTDGSPSGNLAEYTNADCKGPLWITGEVTSVK